MAAPPASAAASAQRLGAAVDAVENRLAEPGDADAIVQRLAEAVQLLAAAAKEARDG